MNPVASASLSTGRCTRRLILGLIVGTLLVPQMATAADSLAVLAYVDSKGKTRTVEIELKTGPVESKDTRTPVERWTLSAGDTLKTSGTPASREVVLFTAGDGEPRQLCTVEVRYYPAGENRFRPLYQIMERIAVVRVGDSWKPVPLGNGDPMLIELPGSGLPNPDGFSERLEFGIPQAAVGIVGWEVR